MDKTTKTSASSNSRNLEKKLSTLTKPAKKEHKERQETRTDIRAESRVGEPTENSPPRYSNPSTPRNTNLSRD